MRQMAKSGHERRVGLSEEFSRQDAPVMNWFYWALGSAFFAGLTAILAKIGVEGVEPNLATALRTTVVVFFTWTIAILSGLTNTSSQLNGRSVLFLILSGFATGASWLCYFRALQLGEASQVAPVDKLSVVFVLIFAALFLQERMHWQTVLGATLIISGTLILSQQGE
jgi:transporter family protein